MRMNSTAPQPASRYQRQAILPHIGADGQRRIGASHALVVGCGALGSVLAENLARAGVGTITIVDRDVVEPTNLHRQTLFTEFHAEHAVPKPIAAAERLTQINSTITINPIADDFAPSVARHVAPNADVLIDATDNFETRYLLNDLATERATPFVYGGVVATRGTQMTIIPGRTPCLRCLSDGIGAAGETCETAGVLAAAVLVVAGLQAADAIKVLSGNETTVGGILRVVDVWDGPLRELDMSAQRHDACPCCVKHRFDFLDAARASVTTALCGRGAVQVLPGSHARVDLEALEARLAPLASTERSPARLRAVLNDERITLTVFANARTLVEGTEDEARARSLVARYVGV